MTITESVDTGPADQRARILETALALMAEAGVHAMSMRRLAAACDLNVATLYHYFPSKADLLREVIQFQHYEVLLSETPPIDRDIGLQERLAEMLAWIWAEMDGKNDMLRLLLGESLRSTPEVTKAVATLSTAFEEALVHWLDELTPELPGDRAIQARMLRGLVYGFFVENLTLPPAERRVVLRERATEIASVLCG